MDKIRRDEGLKGNEKIEEYIEMLQKEPSAELLSVVRPAVRRRMKEGGQFIVPVDAGKDNRMQIQVMMVDGVSWLPAFTGFEEELKGKNSIMSTFMADIGQIIDMALAGNVAGVLLNPWDRTLRLDKNLLNIIKGTQQEKN